MDKPIRHVVSISGGKDSTAMALLALEAINDGTLMRENVSFVFADTGNEHQQTYEYVDYLRQRLQIEIDVVRADFADRIARKRETVQTKWRAEGVDESIIQRALSVLHPTGNPFLDCAIYHGRFPSRKVAFCSMELKHQPIEENQRRLMKGAQALISWQGVRADESRSRRDLPMHDVEFGSWDPQPTGLLIYRPIIAWNVEQVFEKHRQHDVEPNPLYSQGMGRVGCMPCVNCRKSELRAIASRFPDEIDRIEEWERIVRLASKKGVASMFAIANGNGENIREVVQWSRTTRGGKQFDLLADDEPATCSSMYGLCE